MGRQPLGTGACVCHNPVLFISPDLQVFSAHFSFAGSVCSPFLSLLPSPPHPHNFGDKFLPIHLCPVGGGLWSFIFFGLCACVSGWFWRREANLTCGSLLLLAEDGALIFSAQTRAAGPPALVSASQVTCSCTGLFGFWVFELSSTHLYSKHFTH